MICKIEYTRINAKRYHKKKKKKEGLFGTECYILYDKRSGGILLQRHSLILPKCRTYLNNVKLIIYYLRLVLSGLVWLCGLVNIDIDPLVSSVVRHDLKKIELVLKEQLWILFLDTMEYIESRELPCHFFVLRKIIGIDLLMAFFYYNVLGYSLEK